jgi:hypothetical protein
MTVKYQCPVCGRKFTEWGAEKAGYKCPRDQWSPKDHAEDVDLVPITQLEVKATTRKPTLKRSPKRTPVTPVAHANLEIEQDETSEAEEGAEEEDVEETENQVDEETEGNSDDVSVDEEDLADEDEEPELDVEEDLGFGNAHELPETDVQRPDDWSA